MFVLQRKEEHVVNNKLPNGSVMPTKMGEALHATKLSVTKLSFFFRAEMEVEKSYKTGARPFKPNTALHNAEEKKLLVWVRLVHSGK